MKLDFRIDFGYLYLYSRRHYHPFYVWDGSLTCKGGTIEKTWQLDYPVIWYGPGNCAKETPLSGPEWKCTTHRGIAGVRFAADVAEDAVFTLHTETMDAVFTAKQILNEGQIIFKTGPKYLNVSVIVTKTGYLWFRPAPKSGQQTWEASNLPLEQHPWARMQMAWLAPGKELVLDFNTPESKADLTETLLHLCAMMAPSAWAVPETTEPVFWGEVPFELFIDGKKEQEFRQYFRRHDQFMQLLEDVWIRFRTAPGKHTLALKNCHSSAWFLISRAVIQHSFRNHGELSLPEWGLVNEKFIGKVYAVRNDHATVEVQGRKIELDLVPGWNEFSFVPEQGGKNIPVTAGKQTVLIDEIADVKEEKFPVTVGYDMTVVPHDGNGFMDWLLDYTWRTRLGNIVVFRSFFYTHPGETSPNGSHYFPPDSILMEKWGRYCREHGITVEAATDFDDGALVRGAGDALHSVGRHEWPGAVYAFDPDPQWCSSDMKEAMEHYLKYLKIEIDRAHKVSKRAAFGDASGGHRYCYMAGIDFLRTETMVPHTQHLCSQARPAAEVFSTGEWGVHIAIQHCYQPYFETHLGQYYLSLWQPWMMGASMIYEEDSLFLLFKEERQTWDDVCTKGKRDMTREFFRYVKTHPRSGKNVRKIAFIEGRYAAPFNGFICGPEQTPDYSVWGRFGNNDPSWGHRQPEKCRHLLDVLMPGASVQPLRQQFDRRRFFFSGTPCGDFDEIPVEAKQEYFNNYEFLLNLGWNTMTGEDYEKLKGYAAQGGILFTGLPQFSTHTKRQFLLTMDDLALWNNGDLSELCGIKVKGRSKNVYSGQWNCKDRTAYPEVKLSSAPDHFYGEDGPCYLADIELAGAEVVCRDACTNQPLIVRNKLGKGYVYTVTAWAYPGHEALQGTLASWIAKLSSEHRGDCYVEDPSGEVFWTRWVDGDTTRLMLLNTDWTVKGNRKQVRIVTPSGTVEKEVVEREMLILTIRNGKLPVIGQ